jgi:CSLREA domain-containing protein
MSGTGRRWLVLAGLAVAAFVTPLAALAADVDVTKTADTNDGVCDADCSLREAIDSANANDTILIPAGTFTVDSELVIDKSLTLQGGGQFDTIVQAAASPGIAGHRIFKLGTNFNVALLDMTIRHGATFGSNGGAILIQGGFGTLDIIRCNVVHNEVNADDPTNGGQGAGGAIFSSGGGLITIRNSNIADNRVTANGGNLGGTGSGGAGFTGPVTIIDSSVVRNTISALGSVANGAASGGAFFSGVVILTNSTASLNGIRAGAASGGAFFAGPTTVSSATVTDNFIEANAASGAAFFATTVTMRNSILAGNLIRGVISNCFFNPTSAGYNLIDDATGCDPPTVGDQYGSSGALIDPRLGPLAFNGGTTETRALLFDSPAIDAANPTGCIDHNGNLLTTDQRGFSRPVDGNNDGVPVCDIGAFEFGDTLAPAPAVGPLGLLAVVAGLFTLAARRLRIQSPRA